MVEVGDKYILNSQNGLCYDIEVVNINHFREIDRIYAIDVYHKGTNVYGDVVFVGDEVMEGDTLNRTVFDNKFEIPSYFINLILKDYNMKVLGW